MNGAEWIVDAQGCSAESLQNLDRLRTLFERIISDLGLRTIGETQWHQFPGTGGITGLCLLSESHLACHTFPEYGSLCLNLFCCVPRPQWDFEAQLAELFSAAAVQVRRLAREYESLAQGEAIAAPEEFPQR
jgi:S-adenosylmethionine decarboxylase